MAAKFTTSIVPTARNVLDSNRIAMDPKGLWSNGDTVQTRRQAVGQRTRSGAIYIEDILVNM